MEEIAKKDMIISNVIAGDFTSFFLFCLIFILIFCFHDFFFISNVIADGLRSKDQYALMKLESI